MRNGKTVQESLCLLFLAPSMDSATCDLSCRDQFQNFQDQRKSERIRLRSKNTVALGVRVAQLSCRSCSDCSFPKSISPCFGSPYLCIRLSSSPAESLTCVVGSLYFHSLGCPLVISSLTDRLDI